MSVLAIGSESNPRRAVESSVALRDGPVSTGSEGDQGSLRGSRGPGCGCFASTSECMARAGGRHACFFPASCAADGGGRGLPSDALIELVLRRWLSVAVPVTRPGSGQVPQRRAAGGRNPFPMVQASDLRRLSLLVAATLAAASVSCHGCFVQGRQAVQGRTAPVVDQANRVQARRTLTATSGRSRSPRKFPVSGRTHGRIKVAAAVDARRRHERGEAVEQLLRRQDLRAVPARAGLGAIVEQLRWRHVDLPRSAITLEDTKNGEPRRVPLTGPALELLQAGAKVRRIDTGLVFPGAGGIRPVELTKAWQRALHNASIQDFRFHDLRHTAASYLAMNGASMLDIGATSRSNQATFQPSLSRRGMRVLSIREGSNHRAHDRAGDDQPHRREEPG